MRKTFVFASRNAKELRRDMLTVLFGMLFPLVLLFLLTAINSGIPKEAHNTLFEIESLVPGVVVFGLSFVALFTATLVSKDRTTSFIVRLFTSPLKASDYILGYALPMVSLSAVQMLVCYLAALGLGLDFSPNILLSAVVNIPAVVLYIGIGLLTGTLLNDKAVGGVCGGLLTNVSAWLSGTWFDIGLIGGAFEKVADCLPFVHSVNAGRFALSGEYSLIITELLWVTGYAVVIFAAAVLIFKYKMKQDK